MQETSVSTGVMIERLSGLIGKRDLNEWESQFVQKLHGLVQAGQVTRLSEKQLRTLADLHRKHFAG